MGAVEVVLNQPIRQLLIKPNWVRGKVAKIDKFILYRSVESLVHRIVLRGSHSALDVSWLLETIPHILKGNLPYDREEPGGPRYGNLIRVIRYETLYHTVGYLLESTYFARFKLIAVLFFSNIDKKEVIRRCRRIFSSLLSLL